MRLSRKKHYLIFILLLSNVIVFGQCSDNPSILKANFLYNFAKYVTWPDQKEVTEFKIGVLGSSSVYDSVVTTVKTRKVGEAPIGVLKFASMSEVGDVQILFADSAFCAQMPDFSEKILLKISGKHMLLVTDMYDGKKSMLNFIIRNGKMRFELNKSLCEKHGLTVSQQLVSLAAAVY